MEFNISIKVEWALSRTLFRPISTIETYFVYFKKVFKAGLVEFFTVVHLNSLRYSEQRKIVEEAFSNIRLIEPLNGFGH